jgi:hypothetical protein
MRFFTPSLLFITVALGTACNQTPSDPAQEDKSGRYTTFPITSLSSQLPSGFAKFFAKEIDVFGVKILATAETQDVKIRHAAHILAEYLDNDEDGKADNARVLQSMLNYRAMLLMAPTGVEFENMFERMVDEIPEERNMILQSLYGEETHPDGAANNRFDFAYEEVLHLVTHAGYSRAYPDAFGEHPDTKLTRAMDVARGGHFQNLPKRYPKDAWYTYYDSTCEYECQATEYLYWGLTSLLGAQDLPGRLEQIQDEWRLNTKEKLRTGDKLLFKLLTDPQYQLPKVLPDGNYRQLPASRLKTQLVLKLESGVVIFGDEARADYVPIVGVDQE